MPSRVAQRQTRPDYTYGFAGGMGIVPRRGWDAYTSRFIAAAANQPTDGLRRFYETAPLRLLQVFLSIHPMAKMATSNNLSLSFCPGDFKIVAVRTVESVDEDGNVTSKDEIDTEGTAELERFWKTYKGGLVAFLRAMGRHALYAGLSCAEAVVGPGLQGVSRVETFEPISVIFEDLADGSRVPKQFYQLDKGLDERTCFLYPVDGDSDNPYGDPIFGAFLAEGMKDFGQESNLSDILRGWAYPHIAIGFPFEETILFASEHPEDCLVGRKRFEDGTIGDLTPYEYAEIEFDKFCKFLANVNPDDPLVMNKGSEAKVLDGASGLAALDPMLKMRRHRQVMGLDQMPSELGITEGGTQAYAVQQAKTSAKKREFQRNHAFGMAVTISDLHLRKQGRDLKSRVDSEPIIAADKVVEANARSTDVRTDMALADGGYMDPNEVAVKHTGSGMHGPHRPARSGGNNPQQQDDGGQGNQDEGHNVDPQEQKNEEEE